MERISINLLPPEFIGEEIKNSKFYKLQAIGVVTILLMCFLSSLTLVLRILQGTNIRQVEAQLEDQEQRVSELKGTQVSLLLLKNRLSTIDQYLGIPSKQASIYKLIDELIPSSVSVNAITIDKTGGAILIASVSDTASLDILVSNLTTKTRNEDKISQVAIESLSRGRDGFYRISFKIKPK